MWDVVEMNSCKKDLKHTSTEVVRQNNIWVNLVESSDEGLKKLPFILEEIDRGIFLLLQPLLQIKRPRLLVQLPNHREAWHLLAVRWAILVDSGMDKPWNHSDLVGVVWWPAGLYAEREASDRWWGFVHVINSDLNIFWAVDIDLLLAPSVLERVVVLNFLHVLDSQPARTLDFPFQNE